jgi:hypothetical protein
VLLRGHTARKRGTRNNAPPATDIPRRPCTAGRSCSLPPGRRICSAGVEGLRRPDQCRRPYRLPGVSRHRQSHRCARIRLPRLIADLEPRRRFPSAGADARGRLYQGVSLRPTRNATLLGSAADHRHCCTLRPTRAMSKGWFWSTPSQPRCRDCSDHSGRPIADCSIVRCRHSPRTRTSSGSTLTRASLRSARPLPCTGCRSSC